MLQECHSCTLTSRSPAFFLVLDAQLSPCLAHSSVSFITGTLSTQALGPPIGSNASALQCCMYSKRLHASSRLTVLTGCSEIERYTVAHAGFFAPMWTTTEVTHLIVKGERDDQLEADLEEHPSEGMWLPAWHLIHWLWLTCE
mmetsp:Transcript_114104/g.160092  ORF Transcript_114104/g.160092 Transcript_114104/m.160092 type:complete len:143 (+) Transcript_114104:226-654(+)